MLLHGAKTSVWLQVLHIVVIISGRRFGLWESVRAWHDNRRADSSRTGLLPLQPADFYAPSPTIVTPLMTRLQIVGTCSLSLSLSLSSVVHSSLFLVHLDLICAIAKIALFSFHRYIAATDDLHLQNYQSLGSLSLFPIEISAMSTTNHVEHAEASLTAEYALSRGELASRRS